jgi:hypothetical protein
VVLAEVAQPCVVRFAQQLERLALAGTDQPYIHGVAACPQGGFRDPALET